MSYEVYCLDNFNIPADSSGNYTWGRYETYEEAVAKAKYIVDLCLTEQYKPGITADALYMTFVMYGDTPMIIGHGPGETFSGRDYAKQRAIEICAAGAGAAEGVRS